YNTKTRKVEENLHITFLENKPMITGGGLEWLFDIDALSESVNYAPVPAGPIQYYILMPLWKDVSLFNSFSQDSDGHNKDKHGPSQESECDNQERPNAESNTKNVNTARLSINIINANDNTGSLNINTVSPSVNTATPNYVDYLNDPLMPDLEDTGIFDDAYDDRDEGAETDYKNLEIVISVSPIPSTRVYKDHPKEHMIGEMEPKKTLVDLPHGRSYAGIVVRNKARLVARGHRQEEGIDYDEVFAPVARIKAIMLLLAYASLMDFTVYQMDVKSAFLYCSIEEEVYVS
nr:copia protein [Tanacetum cinerariifolium]